jgi:iron complex outermembrane receptor protein
MKLAYLCGASLAAVTLAGLGESQALAQTAGAQAAANVAAQGATGGAPNANVTVVAEKRAGRLERVPVAITAITARQRDILGIETVQQLSDFTPGLSYYAIADRAYIRGIGRNTVNLATESGVATYFNGVYYGANATIAEAHDSLFIGQIEVDRGPQNTLHGSNSDGGVINYISTRPTKSLYAEGRIGVQNYDEEYAEAVVSGPINDHLRVQVGGNYSNQTGGFFRNLIGPPEGGYLPQGNGGKSQYFEAQFDANIGEHLDAWGQIATSDYETNFHTVSTVGNLKDFEFANGDLTPGAFFGLCGLPGHAADAGCIGPASPDTIVPGSVITAAVNAAGFPGNDPTNTNIHNFIETSHQENRQTRDLALALNLTYHFPSADLQYIAGYQQFYYDLDFGPGVDAGVLQYQLQGAPNAFVAGIGCGAVLHLAGPALGSCVTAAQQPLTIHPNSAETLFIENEQYFSHELNLISTQPGPLQWITGLYWYHEHFNQPIAVGCYPFQTQLVHPISLAAFLGHADVPAAVNHDSCTVNLDGFATYDSYAGYGQATYQIDPQWKIEGALRYTADHKTGGEAFRVVVFNILHPGLLGAATPSFDVTPVIVPLGVAVPGSGPSMYNANTGNVTRTLAHNWSGVTGDVTLTWTPDSETLGYARYARGYKTGGFNSGTISAHPLTQPEYVDAFEVGIKKTVGSMLQFNGEVFYYAWKNDQQPLAVQTAAAGVTAAQIFNIPSVHDYGVELEAIWRPIDPLTITAVYSFLSAKVASMNGQCVANANDSLAILPGDRTNGCAFAGQVNLVGNTLAESPRNKVALNATYTFSFDAGKLSLSAAYIWKDSTYGAIFNVPQNLAPAYSQVNLRANWDDAQGRYSVIAWVNNVFNTIGYDNVTETQLDPNSTLGPPGSHYDILTAKGLTYPLTFGAELQVRFR